MKNIAVEEGDYNNGTSRVKQLEKALGSEEKIEWYKKNRAEKYQNLVDIDERETKKRR